MMKEVKKFGQRGGHIIVPGSLVGKTLEIDTGNLIPPEKEVLTKKEVGKMIEDAIYKAKSGYI